MRSPLRKITFTPTLDRAEARVLTAGGLVSAASHHGPAAPAHVAAQGHHAKHPAPKAPHHPSSSPPADPTPPVVAPPAPPTVTSAGGQAWVKFINMTGSDVSYKISLYPYAQGAFLTGTIPPAGGLADAQYLYSGLTLGGKTVAPAFQIQFGTDAPVPLMVGSSQATAQGYYIFQDTEFRDYVEPFRG